MRLPIRPISSLHTIFSSILYLRDSGGSRYDFACDNIYWQKGSISWAFDCCVLLKRILLCPLCVCALFIKEKRRLAIRNAAQQWEGVRACLELPPTNGAKEEVSPENSPAHSPAQTNGLAQEPSPDEPRYKTLQQIKSRHLSRTSRAIGWWDTGVVCDSWRWSKVNCGFSVTLIDVV